MTADHIDTHEQQPAFLELGPHGVADFLLALGQLRRLGIAADGEVGAEFALARLAVDRARDLAIDQHDTLVALGHFGEEGLDHEGFAPDLTEQLDQRREVRAILADQEHRLAAIAVQRLHHDRTMLRLEALHLVERAGDQRGRHEAFEIEHIDLFGRVAHRCGVVDHERAALEPLENVCRSDIADIEGRILPHQHNIDILAQVEPHRIAEAVMVAGTLRTVTGWAWHVTCPAS